MVVDDWWRLEHEPCLQSYAWYMVASEVCSRRGQCLSNQLWTWSEVWCWVGGLVSWLEV